MKDLPKELITSVRIFTDNKYFDTTITLNVFGEVLDIQNDYAELPEAALKMMYGGRKVFEKKEPKEYLERLKKIIPMMALGLNGKVPIPDCLSPIVDALKKLKTLAEKEPHLVPRDFIKDQWTRDLYKDYELNSNSKFLYFSHNRPYIIQKVS